MSTEVKKIKKRNGKIVDFDKNKISNAIFKAAQSIGGSDRETANQLSKEVSEILHEQYDGHTIPKVEEIQDIIEKVLMDHGHRKTAKAYILYRQKRKEMREAKAMIGIEDDVKMDLNALTVLKGRYLNKNEQGEVIETPGEMFRRVAKNISEADLKYDKSEEKRKEIEDKFNEIMVKREFLPNSPTLMNAGLDIQQLAACFVLPIPDSMEGIFNAVKDAALIHKSGGGTGFSFSRLRGKGDRVKSTKGVASGPISFMKVFNAATEVVKQGGKRRGANMGVLRVDHPDIMDFITAKERTDALNNFNISVGLTEKFMEAVESNEEYELINPRTKEVYKKVNARKVFELIVTMAWKNGEPGILFLDRINKQNPTPKIGEIESTNPCGEQPLLPFESCNLGSINLSKFVENREINWERLKAITKKSVHFLDNVIDMGKYPLQEIDDMVRANRKIGLGVMGFADMLIKLKIPYNSQEAVDIAEKIMSTIEEASIEESRNLAIKRGAFPNFDKSVFKDNDDPKIRNATLTTIAPTGTISIIGGCSSGIEPLFAVSFIRKTPQFELLEVNPLFEEIAREEGFYTEDLMQKVAGVGSIQDIEEIPEKVKKIFVTTHDISPEWHVKIQAAFQQHVDNAVSKTINFPNDATLEDIEDSYMLAYKLGCKGITVYRDGSRNEQVLNIDKKKEKKKEEKVKQDKKEEQKNNNAKEHPVKKKNGKVIVDAEYAGGCPTCSL